jgi:hypothetical protein
MQHIESVRQGAESGRMAFSLSRFSRKGSRFSFETGVARYGHAGATSINRNSNLTEER